MISSIWSCVAETKQYDPEEIENRYSSLLTHHLSVNSLDEKTISNHEGLIIGKSFFITRELHPKWACNWNATGVCLSKKCVEIREIHVANMYGFPHKFSVPFSEMNVETNQN